MTEREEPESLAQIKDFLVENRKFWARRWYDYLTIGNAGALLACTSALVQSKHAASVLIPSAWCFFGGLVSAAALPKVRYWTSFFAYRVISQKRRMQLFSVKVPIKALPLSLTLKFIVVQIMQDFCEILAVVFFSVGVAMVLLGVG